MNYQILARKYRPRTFAEVVGQEPIVGALQNAVERDRLAHAYLLVGPRGVGKTSTARILAKSINCLDSPGPQPCLACDACQQIEAGGDLDVIEIDGASNNGVDDVRAIRDRVHYLPQRDRRKIYIVDEVQRLTGPAFDALLKTLEEPPEHAMFIFATTDPHKIPETIRSRCQSFEFRRLSDEAVRAKLRSIADQEQVEVSDEVLHALARGCRGGLRDAESMLDQLLVASDGPPTLENLESVAGLARPERWERLFGAIAEQDRSAVLVAIREFLDAGGTERDLVEQAVEFLRDLLRLAICGADAGLPIAEERRKAWLALARKLGADRVETLLGMLCGLEARMNRAPMMSRALLEWTLLRGARLGELLDATTLLAGGMSPAPNDAAPAPPAVPSPRSKKAANPNSAPQSADPVDTTSPAANDDSAASLEVLLSRIDRDRPTLGGILRKAFLSGGVQENGVELRLRPLPDRERELLQSAAELRFLERLPGSPGPWQIRFEETQGGAIDPLGQELKTLFDTREEVP